MINLLTKGIQLLNKEFSQYQQLRINVENESQAMCCGAFSPQFLAMIKRSNTSKAQRKLTGDKSRNLNNY